MGKIRYAIVAVICLWIVVANGQDVRSTVLEKPKPVRELAAAPLKRNQSAERERFRGAISKIREHYRPVPLSRTSKPFESSLNQTPAKIVKKGEPISFPKNIKILGQQSIVGSAELEFNFASPIGEPTVAATATEVLVTGNWYAALSLDGGKTFSSLNPDQLFAGGAVGEGFCCDQVAFYDQRADTTFWLLQGARNAKGNMFRILFAKGSEQLRKQDWQYLDITAPQVVGSEGFWLDFPSFAATDSHIYLTANVFTAVGEEKWSGGLVVRIPKEPLLKGEQPSATTWSSSTFGSLRLVEGAKDTMYWASQSSTGALAVWSWPDSAEQPSKPTNVDVETWTTDTNGASKLHSPSGRPWLKRLDGRITAGWLSLDTIGFAWTAREDNRFKLPHVRVAVLGLPLPTNSGPFASVKPKAEPHIWSDDFALAYPAMGVDAKGRVAVTTSIGGKSLFPTHALGTLTRNGDIFKWGFAVSTRGANTPYCARANAPVDQNCGVWGDYFTVRPHPGRDNSWVTVGYSIRSQATEVLRVEPEFYWFHSE